MDPLPACLPACCRQGRARAGGADPGRGWVAAAADAEKPGAEKRSEAEPVHPGPAERGGEDLGR